MDGVGRRGLVFFFFFVFFFFLFFFCFFSCSCCCCCSCYEWFGKKNRKNTQLYITN